VGNHTMSLAALKAELEKKRKANAPSEDATGSKYLRRGEVEKLQHPKPETKKPTQKEEKPLEEEVPVQTKESDVVTPPTEQTPPISREVVIQRLRQHQHPVTLFGETDWQRYMRLKLQEEQEPIEYLEGMDNEFAKEVRNVEDNHDKKTAHDDDFALKPKLSDSLDSIVAIPDGREAKDKEEFILILLKTMLSQWEQELNDRPDLEKRTAQGKVATATYNQCRKHIKPLFKLLRERHLPKDILDPIRNICCFIQEREYVKANDAYLTMAIGNAPWPMGVTMVGIHERSAREKIFTNQVAHVLNDETQRKYIQAIKRIMTWSQRKYPNDPSKCVG